MSPGRQALAVALAAAIRHIAAAPGHYTLHSAPVRTSSKSTQALTHDRCRYVLIWFSSIAIHHCELHMFAVTSFTWCRAVCRSSTRTAVARVGTAMCAGTIRVCANPGSAGSCVGKDPCRAHEHFSVAKALAPFACRGLLSCHQIVRAPCRHRAVVSYGMLLFVILIMYIRHVCCVCLQRHDHTDIPGSGIWQSVTEDPASRPSIRSQRGSTRWPSGGPTQ